MKLGLEVLSSDPRWLRRIKKKRIGLVCHPASVDERLKHSLDLLSHKIKLSCAFGPQHGARGDKQDNMIESADFTDPIHGIPIFSLYGKVRRPTPEMMTHFDVLLFDLQDLGCRIYTFITTLLYLMEECARHNKAMIILDRPNPAGRIIEGYRLRPGWESFVGAAPIPMRHGLTAGELALYYKAHFKLDLELDIIKMRGYRPDRAPGWGWPMDRAWVNPSPNAASVNMARAYSGTVLIEGTTLSEARGTTRALEIIGAPDVNFNLVLAKMQKKAPHWLKGAILRECHFEPTFNKHKGQLCHGIQFHTDFSGYRPATFTPFRAVALMLKVIRDTHPSYPLFRNFAYEYVTDKLAFDVINGGPELREWIEAPSSEPSDLERALREDESSWQQERRQFLIY
jgi:uncharacterized protein YbbC (DUF1343 family)